MDPNKYRKAFDELSFSADFEERTQDLLRRRARSLNPSKSSSEKENRPMNLKFFRKPLVFAAAAALLVVSVSAAALFLRPSEVAQHHTQPVLAQAFEDQNAIVVDQPVETVAELLKDRTISAAQLCGHENASYIAALRSAASRRPSTGPWLGA